MQSVLGEIAKLRNGNSMIFDYHNSNRYCLAVQENNGSKTAYYFSTPIYNRRTGKMIDIKFQSNGGAIYSTGSNTNITVSNSALMENAEGSCTIGLPQKCSLVSPQEAHCGNIVLFPTANGVALKCAIKANEKIRFIVDVGQPFLNVRANDKCFALMKEQFRAFVIISCIGSLDATGNVIAPAKIEYQKLTDKKYQIAVYATNPLAQYVLFESNLYENKLFQDTTVESNNPLINNTFGSVGFIGNSLEYGEQWLYSRPDFDKLSDLDGKKIKKAILHLPKYNNSDIELQCFKVSARFCSVGSNWLNKIPESGYVSQSVLKNTYHSIDLTDLLTDNFGNLSRSEGLILRTKTKDRGFTVIATGDSYYTPQILEINF